MIVLDDADTECAIIAAMFGAFVHQGQTCMSVERIMVDEAVADEFTRRFVDKVKTISYDITPNCVVGPIINQKQLDKIHNHVTDAVKQGAEMLLGGTHDGLVYAPTALTNGFRRHVVPQI